MKKCDNDVRFTLSFIEIGRTSAQLVGPQNFGLCFVDFSLTQQEGCRTYCINQVK